jgi:lysylphosphatidylglycerol synthetase-like protein (DUF2156 family)
MNATWLPPLAAMILTPIIVRALARNFPVRAASPGEYQALRPHYRWLEIASQVAALFGIVGSVMLLIALHVGNTPWLLGAAFGWAVITPVLLIAVLTLPRGITQWREFWRFYELTYQTSLRFLAPVFVLFGALGVISTAVLLSR